MNKKIITIILISLYVIFYPFFSNVALATVGGPMLLSDFGYSEKDGMVYFTRSDYGGMGGQSIVRYNPITQKEEAILSNMDEGFAIREDYEIQKERIWKNLSELPRIDLSKNDIKIEAFIKERGEITSDLQLWRSVIFQIIVGQGLEKEIGRFELNGCEWIESRRTKNFEINFDGFLIPNSNSILFLASTVGDCFEMGYVLDEIFLIDGFKILDSRPIASLEEARNAPDTLPLEYRGAYPCFNVHVCPTQGGILLSVSNDIAIADEEPPAQGEIQPETIEEYREPEEQQEKPKMLILILGSAVSILSLFLIYLYFKKRGKPKS